VKNLSMTIAMLAAAAFFTAAVLFVTIAMMIAARGEGMYCYQKCYLYDADGHCLIPKQVCIPRR
jgi:hypothetical protein